MCPSWGWHQLAPSHVWLQVHDLVKALSKCVHQAFPITTEPAKAFHSGQATCKFCVVRWGHPLAGAHTHHAMCPPVAPPAVVVHGKL